MCYRLIIVGFTTLLVQAPSSSSYSARAVHFGTLLRQLLVCHPLPDKTLPLTRAFLLCLPAVQDFFYTVAPSLSSDSVMTVRGIISPLFSIRYPLRKQTSGEKHMLYLWVRNVDHKYPVLSAEGAWYKRAAQHSGDRLKRP